MKRTVGLLLASIIVNLACAQADLHVKGKIKSDSLVNSAFRIIIADSTGTLDTLEHGQAGQVLISNGGAAGPSWGNVGSRILYHNVSLVTNTSSTGMQLLDSYAVPPNTLTSDGDWLEIEFHGSASASMSNGEVHLIMGVDTLITDFPLTVISGEGAIAGRVKLSRISGVNQRSVSEFIYFQTGNSFIRQEHTYDLTQSQLISIYAQNPTGMANTFTIYDFSVRIVQ